MMIENGFCVLRKYSWFVSKRFVRSKYLACSHFWEIVPAQQYDHRVIIPGRIWTEFDQTAEQRGVETFGLLESSYLFQNSFKGNKTQFYVALGMDTNGNPLLITSTLINVLRIAFLDCFYKPGFFINVIFSIEIAASAVIP